MSLRFETARHEDLRRIVEIYNQIIPSRLATADLEPLITSDREAWFHNFTPTHPLWVVRSDTDEILGWVGLEPFYGRPAYEHTAEVSIYIDQNARHQGLGSQALEFVIAQLPSLNVTALAAYIFGHNQPSLGLFKKFGFEQWGWLPAVAELDGQKRDLVIMGQRFD